MGGKHKPNRKRPTKAVPNRGRIADSIKGLPEADTSGERVSWRFGYFDWDGPFGFVDLDDFRRVCEQLQQWETMTQHEVFTGGHPGKRYEQARIPTKEAPKRLAQLGLDDQTEIWRLRTNGPGRLYGYRVGCVFHMVFWDPKHQIWPSQR